jgi:hypothetical protein
MLFESWLGRLTTGSATRSRRPRTRPTLSRRSVLPRLEVLEDRSLPSTFTVANLHDSGPGSLRQAVLDANAHPGADLIRFADNVHGTITLTSGALAITDSLTIDGPGEHRLTLSGNNASRVFDISNHATVSIDQLTMTNGKTVGGDGGGILNEAGATLSLDHVLMTNNQAVADNGGLNGGSGGGIENLGSLTVTLSTFSHNRASLNSTTVASNGGAIDTNGLSLTVNDSTFSHNEVRGSSTGIGIGQGGAISTGGSPATVTNCAFDGNTDSARIAQGGAISTDTIAGSPAGLMTVRNSTFIGNRAVGANGANDLVFVSGGEALGGAIWNSTPFTITNSTFTDNLAKGGDGGDNSSDGIDFIAGGGQVGSGTGGAVVNYFSSLTVTGSTFTDNKAIGGNSAMGPGGDAAGGGVIAAGTNLGDGSTTLSNVTFVGNEAVGGRGAPGSRGGTGFGGGFYSGIYSTAAVSQALFLDNRAVGGRGGAGAQGGDAAGGAIANGGGLGQFVVALIGLGPDNSSLTLDHSTLIFNEVQGGAGGAEGGGGGAGLGGGAYNDGAATLTLSRSLVIYNDADGGRGRDGGADGAGIGGGVYNTLGGTFSYDAFTVIAHNDASTSGDNIGP